MRLLGIPLPGFSRKATTYFEKKSPSPAPEKPTNPALDKLAGNPSTGHKNKSGEAGRKKWLFNFNKREAAKKYPDNPVAALHWQGAKADLENLPKGPVFKPNDLSINKEFLKSLVLNLDNALPEVPKVPEVSPKVSEKFFKQKENLSNAFFKIYASVSPSSPRLDNNYNPAVTEGALALAVRDGFADAAKSAKKLATALRSEGHVAQAEKYAALAELCVALKRAHLAGGARHILDEFTQQEVKKIEKVAPGLNRAQSGAIIEKSKGASFFVKAGRLAKGKVGGGFSKADTLMVDDDKDINFWTLYGFFVNGGVKTKVKNVFTNYDGTSRTGKVGMTFGPTYKETGTLPEMVKMTTVREAENSFAWSAGPKRRGRDRWMRGLEKSMGNPSRITQRSANIPLYLSQRKVEKGAFNQDVMALLAEKFDGDKDGALTTLIKGAYPSATTSLAAKETLASPMAYVPRPPEPAGATGYRRGREGWTYKAADINYEVKEQIESRTSSVGGRLKSAMEAGGEIRQFGLERLKGSHAFLDVAYNKDIDVPIRLFKEMESAGNHAVRLHLYRKVNELITGEASDVLAEQGSTWPAALSETRVYENPQETLAKVETACALLKNKYQKLIEAGSILRAARNHPDVDLKEDIKAAFETISREIWNEQNPNGSEKPLQPPKTTSQITTFLAQSYDAVSLALGAIGLHLTILKNETLAKKDANDQVDLIQPIDQGDLTNSIANANLAYKGVRELMDGFFLPISHDQLMRHSTISSPGVSRKMELKFTHRFRAGAKLNPLEALAKTLSEIPGMDWLNLGNGTMLLEVNNGGGTALLDVGVKYTNSKHPNLGRGGHFIDLNVKGGIQAPCLKEVLEKVPAFLEKTMKKAKLKTTGADEEKTADVDKNLSMMVIKQLGVAMKTVAKEAYAEGGWIKGVQIRFHAFPNTLGSSKKLGFEWQYTRFTKEDLLGVNGNIAATNGGLEKLGGEINFQTSQRTATPESEYMGGDLAYHMLQFPGLDKILRSAATKEERKKLLDEHPFVKSQFFSTTAIFKIVKSHAKFLKSIEEGAVKKHYGFYMYHDGKYEKFLKNAAEQAFYAGTGNVDPENAPNESIYARMMKNYVSAADVSRAEAELEIKQIQRKYWYLTGESKEPSAVDTTVDYFLNDDPNVLGQKILDAYCNILSTYREANASLMVNEGYQLQLREPGTVKKTGTLSPVREDFESESETEDSEYESASDTVSETVLETVLETEDSEYESADEEGPALETPVLETVVLETVRENKKNPSENSKNVLLRQLARIGKQSKPASLNPTSASDSSAVLTEKSSRRRSSIGNSLLKRFGIRNAKESGVNKGDAVVPNKPVKVQPMRMQEEQRKLHKAAKALLQKAGRITLAQNDRGVLRSLTDYQAELAKPINGIPGRADPELNDLIRRFENRVLPSTEMMDEAMNFEKYEKEIFPRIADDEYVRRRWEARLTPEETCKARLFDAQRLLGREVGTLKDAHIALRERFHWEFNQLPVPGGGRPSFDFVRARDWIQVVPSLFPFATPGVKPPSPLTKIFIEKANSSGGLKLDDFFTVGDASPDEMNCLLDSLRQVSEHANLTPPTIDAVRKRLVEAGLAAVDEPINAQGITGEAIVRQYGVRLTILVQNGNRYTINPTVGEPDAPEVYVLLNPGGVGHFTPLYPN